MTDTLARPHTHPPAAGPAADPGGGPARERRTSRWPWWAMLVGAAVGIVSGTLQTLDRIAYAANGTSSSVCEINAFLSCSSVYEHWQSSALGIPNTMIGVPVFAVVASAGLAGLLGTRPSRAYLATVLGLTVFMAGFITWYLAQSAFAIGILCLYCAACMLAVTIAGAGVTRAAASEGTLGEGRAGRALTALADARADVAAWTGLAVIVATMLYLGLVH